MLRTLQTLQLDLLAAEAHSALTSRLASWEPGDVRRWSRSERWWCAVGAMKVQDIGVKCVVSSRSHSRCVVD